MALTVKTFIQGPQSLLLLGSLFSLAILTSGCGGQTQAVAPAAVPVKLQVVKSGNVADSSEFVGTLESKRRVILRPETNGRIIRVFAAQGDLVNPGSPILQLRPEQSTAQVEQSIATVYAQRAAMQSAEAEVRVAEADVARAQAEVKRQEAAFQSSKADLELAEINFQRAATLVGQGVEPQQSLDNRSRERDNAIAGRDAAAEALDAARKSLQASEARLRSARTAVERAAADVARAEAGVVVQEENLGFTRVVAPIAGMVGDLLVKEGDFVNTGQELTRIVQNGGAMDLRINVPVERQSQLRPGVPVAIIDQEGNVITQGSISFINPTVNTASQAILATVTFSNEDGRLRDGQYVRARAVWSQRPGVLIPTTAVSRVAGQEFVFVATETTGEENAAQMVVRQTPVKLGTIQGADFHVLEGIKPGDQIAVSNILRLRNNVPIQPES
ncbi:efflux RND transporter periplasmic adaptor subunit [Trichothermofontia sp.]